MCVPNVHLCGPCVKLQAIMMMTDLTHCRTNNKSQNCHWSHIRSNMATPKATSKLQLHMLGHPQPDDYTA